MALVPCRQGANGSGVMPRSRAPTARPGAKWILALAALPPFLLVGTVPATGAPRCDTSATGAPPRVELSMKAGRVTYDNNLDRDRIRRLQRKSTGGSGWAPIGLTLADLTLDMKVRVKAVPVGERLHCATLTAVDTTLGYDTIRVYIDRKYRPGSCQHRSILNHENLHVGIFRNTAKRFAIRIKTRLVRAAARMQPVRSHSARVAAKRLRTALQREVQPLFRELDRTIALANAEWDTPENYRHEQARCPRW